MELHEWKTSSFTDPLDHIAAASEIVALTPLKSNSIVQLLLQALYAIARKKD